MENETADQRIADLEKEVDELQARNDGLVEKLGEAQEKIEELEEKLKIYRRCMDEIEYQAKQAERDTR